MNQNHLPRSPFSAPFSKSVRETRLRIRNIVQWKKKRPPLLVFTLLCMIVMCSGSLVSCRNDIHQTELATSAPTSVPTPAELASPQPSSTLAPEESQSPDLNSLFSHGFMDGLENELLESGAKFKGSHFINDRELNMKYSILNGTFTHTLNLNAGDVLHVDLRVEEGTLGVMIVQDGNTGIYQNNNLQSSQFDLEIAQSGSYQVTVTGVNTKGSILVQA